MQSKARLFLYLFIGSLNLFPLNCFSQYSFVPINRETSWSYEAIVDSFKTTHLMIKPFYYSPSHIDSLTNEPVTGFFKTNLLDLGKNRNTTLNVNPLLTTLYTMNVFSQKDQDKKDLVQFSGGLQINAAYKNLLAFSSNMYINYTNYPTQTERDIDSTGFIPFNGEYLQKNNQAYYSWFSFRWRLLLVPSEYIHFELGNDKHFLGEGYRSLFLSTNSNAFPYIKTSVQAWRIKYIWMLCFLHDKYPEEEVLTMKKKYCALHMLSYNVTRYLNFNLFEAVVWRDEDTSGYRGIEVEYLNPIIFYRPLEHSLSSPDNEILGIGGRLLLFRNYHLYGQFIMDEFILDEILSGNGSWTNKYGIQAGLKSYHFLGIKNLFFLAEYNTVRPYTYSHKYTLNNYGNYSQPLAHPLGANFREYIGILKYQKNRWSVMAKFVKADCGVDTIGSNWGQDIYKNYSTREQDYGNETLQGVKTNIFNSELRGAFIVNPAWKMQLEAGIKNQYMNSTVSKYNDWFFFIGIRTLLYDDTDEDWTLK